MVPLKPSRKPENVTMLSDKCPSLEIKAIVYLETKPSKRCLECWIAMLTDKSIHRAEEDVIEIHNMKNVLFLLYKQSRLPGVLSNILLH